VLSRNMVAHQGVFLCAAQKGGAAVLTQLYNSRAEVNDHDKKGRTALFFAEDTESVRLLVEWDCDVNWKDHEEQTALIYAVNWIREEACEALLELRANPDAADSRGRTALHWAGSAHCVKLLLAHNAGPDARDEKGETPLFWAAKSGRVEAVRFLVASGASVDALDCRGQTALFEAARREHLDVVRVLVEEAWADPGIKGNSGQTAAQAAAQTPGACNPKRDAVIELLARSSQNIVFQKSNPDQQTRGQRRRYCIVFEDPNDESGSRKIPFESPEYEDALRRLCEACPWLSMDLWAANAPLTKGPEGKRQKVQ